MKIALQSIKRKTLLYKTGVEYGDYTINHVEGCSHGCLYPCYAMMMAKRFNKIKGYADWIKPKIVKNVFELLDKEIPKYKDKIEFVHLCFSTDPFMYNIKEIGDLSVRIIEKLNDNRIKCTALTKGVLPKKLVHLSQQNEMGITLISLSEKFRKVFEPFSASYVKRINSLYYLHKEGIRTWVSIEPYPTPNILSQDFDEILDSISFVDKIIFGRLHYNTKVSQYPSYQDYYNGLTDKVINFCKKNGMDWHIKKGTYKFCDRDSKKLSTIKFTSAFT